MRPGLMTTGPLKEWRGQAMDLDGYLAMLRSWGLETLDIFPPFIDPCGLDTAAAKLAEHGLETACFYAPADLISDDAEAMAAARQSFERGLECCAALGSPLLFTYGSQHAYAGDDNFARYQDRLAKMLELVEATDVVLVVENAGTLMHAAEPMAALVAALDSPQFKLALDTGNFYLWSQDEAAAVERLMPHAVHFHIKECGRRWTDEKGPHVDPAVLGEGNVQHGPIFDTLARAGYTGALAFERTGQDEDGFEASVRTLVGWCRSAPPAGETVAPALQPYRNASNE